VHREQRARTSAGPRPVSTPSQPPVRPISRPAPRHQASRHAKEQRYQRLSLIGAGVIVVIVAVLLGVGWYQSYVLPYHQAVITVGRMNASMDYFIKRVKQVLPEFQSGDPQTVVSVVPDTTADQITQEFVVLQRAQTEGVSASEQEVDQEMQRELGVATINGAAPARAAFENAILGKLADSGLTLGEYRQQIRATVLKNKVQNKLGADYPKTGPAAQYQTLIFNKQDDAKTYLDRLNGGESWDSVAAAVRANPTVGSAAQFDFQPKIEVDDKLAGPLFALNNGQHTDVIATGDGKYTIALMVNRDDSHPITQDQINAISPKLYNQWMDAQQKSMTIKQKLTDAQRVFAIQHAGYQPSSQQQRVPSQQVTQPVTQPVVQPPAPAVPSLPPGIATPAGGLVPPPIPVAPPASGSSAP
jgi:hypothetical protein